MVDSIRLSRTDPDRQFERFGDETLAVACQTLGAQWGSFYRLGDNLRLFGFRNRGIPREFGNAYARRAMEIVDPLHAFRVIPRKHRFVTMGDARAESPERHRDFLSFLRSFGAEEAGEMIFRYNDTAIAGLSLVWLGRRPERRTTVDVGRSLQSYIEFNLGNLQESIAQIAAPANSASPCDFTGRELEVIDVVCRGFTNQQIARHLNIGVATVKTHLMHVFKKAGVETRGKLISRVLGAH
jgi:DNA-binding CsgD family transcriptional regulator